MHQYLEDWDSWRSLEIEKGPFRFVMYSPEAPDTNIVIFAVAPNNCKDLATFNKINQKVYRKFSILAEHGNRSFSYLQRYFLSKTDFQAKRYPFAQLANFFDRAGIPATEDEYSKSGVVVLRATVMNPYLQPMLKGKAKKDLLFEFVTELEREATSVIRAPEARRTKASPHPSASEQKNASAVPDDLFGSVDQESPGSGPSAS